jgi:GT2 family glycosyltransferase
MHLQSATGATLAVVVVYERRWRDVHAAESLEAALRGAKAEGSDVDVPRVGGLLIYDNSSEPIGRPAGQLTNCEYVHDASNGGTRAAYLRGLQLAKSRGFSWLLLLDHDTTLPAGYFEQLNQAIARLQATSPLQSADQLPPAARPPSSDRTVGLLFPLVIGERGVLSPAVIDRWGTIRPVDSLRGGSKKRVLTAVASGSAIRVDALAAVGTIPATLWLDYLDHWLFLRVQKLGYDADFLSATVRHDLSIRSATPPSLARLRNILEAERLFTCTLGLGARIAYPFRLLLRAIRMLPSDRAAARMILQQLVTARRG